MAIPFIRRAKGASIPDIRQGPHEHRIASGISGAVTHVRHTLAMPIRLSLNAANEPMSRPRASADTMTGITGENPLRPPRKRNISDMATNIGEIAAGKRNPVPSCLNLCLRQFEQVGVLNEARAPGVALLAAARHLARTLQAP